MSLGALPAHSVIHVELRRAPVVYYVMAGIPTWFEGGGVPILAGSGMCKRDHDSTREYV